MLDKLKNRLRETTEKIVSQVTTGFKVSEEIQQTRIDICNSCEKLHSTNFCTLCGCYMPVKTFLSNAKCPMDKWKSVDR